MHSLFDWKISKTDHVRVAVNVFVCNLDRRNDTKVPKKLFLSKKYIILDSRQFIQKIPLTPPADGIISFP